MRYLAGLLVFLGLLGTFWGLIETVGSIGRIISTLRTGADAAVLFDELKTGLAQPLAGMGISFSSSLFGLAGSLVLGFLDLQAGQAQNRFYTELEDWLASSIVRRRRHRGRPRGRRSPTTSRSPSIACHGHRRGRPGAGRRHQAMASLAEGIQGLVQHMRSEQQMIRDWVEAQATREKEMKQVLERLTRERIELIGGRSAWRPPHAAASAAELLAGLRRRPVDAAARHHVPAVGVRARRSSSCAGRFRPGRGAGPAQPRRSPN